MRVVIHGGMHKTGTTSVQSMMASHRPLLAQHGVLYPDFGGPQHSKVLNAKKDAWSPRRLMRTVEQARETGAHTLFLSGEVTSTLSAPQFVRLGAAFEGCDVTLVLSFRHWSGFLPSRWAQNCKRRDSQTFDSYMDVVTAEGSIHPDARFDRVLDAASANPGWRVAAISYDNAMRVDGSIAPQVIRAAGLSPVLIGAMSEAGGRRNERLDWRRTELSRAINGALADRRGLAQDDLCRTLGAFEVCEPVFRVGQRLGALEPDLLEGLLAAVEPHRQVRAVAEPGVARAVRERLETAYARRFVNALGGRVFPDGLSTEISVTDLDWRAFADLAGPAFDAAVEHFELSAVA